MINTRSTILLFCVWVMCIFVCGCADKQDVDTDPSNKPNLWTTTFDETLLLSATYVPPGAPDANQPVIQVDTGEAFQDIEGFGYTLTGGSAYLIQRMEETSRNKLLTELFSCVGSNLCISYLRLSLGASDLSEEVFSYNDLPPGETDVELKKFNLSRDTLYLIPLLKKILTINPDIKLMASPWSAPVWMKSNKQSIGGNLLPEYQAAYAAYFVKYIQAMKNEGIDIDAITVQNEPQHGGNNPSMIMSFLQQTTFVKDYLGPAFKAANLNVKIIIWDHNCDNYQYPLAVLSDPEAKSFIHGTAFHLYGGEIGALSLVHGQHPDKKIYFTEQWTGGNTKFSDDLKWHMRNVVIGSTRNWSSVVLEWNLASDPKFEPHLAGGCSLCQGAVTVNGNVISRNVSYYIIAHASRFVKPNARRIASTWFESLPNVTFLNPDGSKVMIILNEGTAMKKINITDGVTQLTPELKPASVSTVFWH